MIRVLFAELTPGTGGSTLSLLHLLRELDRTRFEPAVLISANNRRMGDLVALGITVRGPDGGPVSPEPDPGRPSAAPGRFQSLPLYRALSARRRFRQLVLDRGEALAPVLRALSPDLVYVNFGLVGGAAVVEAARRADLPCVCHERGLAVLHRPYRRLAGSVRRFVSISRAVDAHLEAAGIPAARRCVIPNGIDLHHFDPDRVPPVDAALLPPGDGPLLVSAGRLVRWKGIHVFLEALARVRRAEPGVRAVVAGEGEARQELEGLARKLGLSDGVLFTGFVEDVRPLIRAGTILVHTAVEPEPFGRTVLEGLALGVPMVAAAGGGVPEIIESDRDGILVEPGDSGALAREILRLLGDVDLRRRLAENGRRRVAEEYDHRLTAKRIESLLFESARSA